MLKPSSDAQTNACRGKRRYTTFATAETMAKRTRRQTEEPVAAYHCPHCNGFHVGTQNKAAREYHHRKAEDERSADRAN